MPNNPDVERAKARLARAHRRHSDAADPTEAAAARTAYNEAKVQAWVERTLATAPPYLSPTTEARLARLLSGGTS